jgi:hypothetical protein
MRPWSLVAWLLGGWLLLLGGIVTLSHAQDTVIGSGISGMAKSASSYQGLGDIISGFAAFYSCGRSYNLAYANGTNPMCDLVASSGGAAVGTLRVKTNGFVDLSAYFSGGVTPAAACAAASGGSCLISKVYDHTGNGKYQSVATTANMATLTFNALNGLPCATSNGSVAYAPPSSSFALTAPYFFTAVAERTGNFTTTQRIMQDTSGSPNLGYRNSTNTVGVNAGSTLTATASDSAFHAFIACASSASSCDGAAGDMVVDGSNNTGTTGTNSATDFQLLDGTAMTGLMCEAAVMNGNGIIGTQITSLNANMHSSTYGWNF